MGPIRFFLALSVLASAVLYTQSAPTDVLGPPRSLEDDLDVNPSGAPLIDEALNKDAEIVPKRDYHEEITADERFYRVYENGTIEFKTALSNGHIQYQRISNKVVNGKTIQVYEGYVSQRYADGRYGTNYYIADENGYRRTRVEVDTVPPVLPRSGPYAPEQQPEVQRRNEDNASSGTKSLVENDKEPASSGKPVSIGETHVAKRQNAIETELPQVVEVTEKSTENVNPEASTEEPALQATEDNVFKSKEDPSPELPRIEENTSSFVEGDANHSETSTVQPTTEENIVKSYGDIEAAPTTEENVSPSIEDNASHSEINTEVPATEENVVKINEDIEATPALPTTEENAISSIEDDASYSETSTELPVAEVNILKANEEFEGSTALPTTEANLSSSVEDHAAHSETSTDVPAADENIVKTSEVSSADPTTETNESSSVEYDASHSHTSTELPTAEENIVKTEDLEGNRDLAAEDHAAREETSTDVPAADENAVKANVELEGSTELPTTETNVSSSVEDHAAHSETSTDIPAANENIVKTNEELEASTELPTTEANVSAPIEDLAAHSETTDVPVTDENIVKTSEDHEVSPAEDNASHSESSTELPAAEETSAKTIEVLEENRSSSVEDGAANSETNTEVSTTEESIVKSPEEDSLQQSLPNTDVTKAIEESSIENETSTNLPELSTEESLQNIHKDLEESNEVSDLPISQDYATKTIENEKIEASEVSPTTEGVLTKSANEDLEVSTEVPELLDSHYNGDKTIQDESIGVSGASPTTEAILTKTVENSEDATTNSSEEKIVEPSTDASSTERAANNSSENKDLEESTDAPALSDLEKNVNKSVEDEEAHNETSTDLTATIEDKDLEAITENSQEHVTASVPPKSEENEIQTGLNENKEASAEVPALSTPEHGTELPNIENNEDTILKASTEIPSTEAQKENAVEENTGLSANELSTSPEESVTNAAKIEEIGASTEQPAQPNLIDILTKKVEISTGAAVTEETVSQSNQTALDVSQTENEKNYETSPALPISEEILTKIIAGDKAQSRGLPELDVTQPHEEKNLHTSTEVPALPVAEETSTKTAENEEVKNESSTEIPSAEVAKPSEDKNLEELFAESATGSNSEENDLKGSTEIPALPVPEDQHINNIHTGEPESLISNVNATKTVIDRESDLLAVENTAGNAIQSSEEKELESDSSSSEENLNETIKKGLSYGEENSAHPALSSSEEDNHDNHINY